MTKRAKVRNALGIRALEALANGARAMGQRLETIFTSAADALDEASYQLRDEGAPLEYMTKECICCHDTGVSRGGWFDPSTCHCPAGILREEAEKAGLLPVTVSDDEDD